MTQPDRYRTGDQAFVRQMNLSAVMHHLLEYAPISRATLADLTGLNKTTVSSLVRELLNYNIVREVGIESTGTGRPAVLLEFNPIAGCIVSAEIGVDFISVIRANFAAEVQWRRHEVTDPVLGQAAILDQTIALLHEASDTSQDGCSGLFGLALGVPGLVNPEQGDLLFAPNLGWRDVPLGTLLRQEFNAMVHVSNEANLAALGEYFFGAARGYEEVLYISAGVGLGGGIVRNGRLISGASGFAGEFGHMTMDPDGEPCACGNRGCWETQVSQAALFRAVRAAIAAGRPSVLGDLTRGDLGTLTVAHVVAAAEADDEVAVEALQRVGHSLGIGIASLVNALNPELVVFGGILSLAGAFLLPIVQEELERRAFPWLSDVKKVVLAQNGVDACVLGGVATVFQRVLYQPTEMVRRAL